MVLGAYLFIIFTFTLSKLSIGGVCSGRLKNQGLRCGHIQKKGCLRSGPNSKKGGGVLKCGSCQKLGVFTAAHTYAGHICECLTPWGCNSNFDADIIVSVKRAITIQTFNDPPGLS